MTKILNVNENISIQTVIALTKNDEGKLVATALTTYTKVS
jgi:hypothetical protein